MADIDMARSELDRLAKAEEGWRARPYLCIARRATIGWGCTSYEDGQAVTLSDPPITRERGQALLDYKLNEGISKVMQMTGGSVGTNQLVALVVCGFNIGWDGLAGSSIIKAHRRGDFAAARRAFGLWNKYRPGGPGSPLVESEVLEARRAREAAIYALPDHHDEQVSTEEPPPIPRQVEPESKTAASPIAQAGVTTSAGGGLLVALEAAKGNASALGDWARTVRGVLADSVGVPPEWVLPGLLMIAGIVIVRWRLRQRAGGWA